MLFPPCIRKANLLLGSAVFLPLLGHVLAHDADIDQILEELLEAGRFEDDCAGGRCSVSMLQKTVFPHRQLENASGAPSNASGVHNSSRQSPGLTQLASAAISRVQQEPSTGKAAGTPVVAAEQTAAPPAAAGKAAGAPAAAAERTAAPTLARDEDMPAPSFFQLGATKSVKDSATGAAKTLHSKGRNASRTWHLSHKSGNRSTSGTPDSADAWAEALWDESVAAAHAAPGPSAASPTAARPPAAARRPASARPPVVGPAPAGAPLPSAGLLEATAQLSSGAAHAWGREGRGAARGSSDVVGSLEEEGSAEGIVHSELAQPAHHAAVLAVLLVALFVLLGVATATLWRALHVSARVQALARWKWRSGDPVRPHVEALSPCRGAEVNRQLPAASGYDCTFSKPVSSGKPLRLQAHVIGPLAGSPLAAPLSQRECVHFSAHVSQQTPDGAGSVPVASCTEGVGFVVSLVDAPDVRIEVCGQDVALFDTRSGRLAERRRFEEAPEHWQDFTIFHRTLQPVGESQASFLRNKDGPPLDFEECALPVGADVTLVGELFRDTNGKLSLQPWHGDPLRPRGPPPVEREAWRTSWEGGRDCEAALPERRPSSDVLQGRVLASDDPLLLHSPAEEEDSAPEPSPWDALRQAFDSAVAAAASLPRVAAANLAAQSRRSDQAPPQERAFTDEMSPPLYV